MSLPWRMFSLWPREEESLCLSTPGEHFPSATRFLPLRFTLFQGLPLNRIVFSPKLFFAWESIFDHVLYFRANPSRIIESTCENPSYHY